LINQLTIGQRQLKVQGHFCSWAYWYTAQAFSPSALKKSTIKQAAPIEIEASATLKAGK
jgi:hypothetical protein